MRIFASNSDKYSGRRSGGNSRYSGGRSGGDRDRSERPQMHDAICDECGRECQVPFRPSGEKPIYCSSCFEKQGNGIPRNTKRDFRNTEMFPAVCDDCGKNCEVPFRPSSDKPIYCSDCFEKRGNERGNNRSSGGSKNSITQSIELDAINDKLDKILILLETKPEKKVVKKRVAKPKKEVVVEEE